MPFSSEFTHPALHADVGFNSEVATRDLSGDCGAPRSLLSSHWWGRLCANGKARKKLARRVPDALIRETGNRDSPSANCD